MITSRRTTHPSPPPAGSFIDPSSMKGASERKALLLAVKPRWSSMLLERTKTVEFRRRGPGHAATGMQLLIYASAPLSALVGYGIVLDCLRTKPAALWSQYADRGGIAEHEFDAYFAGTGVGDALLVECRPLPYSVDLGSLRCRYNWRPPMSWSWVPASSPLLPLIPIGQR
jgi:predicted transcriptional regulator